MYAITNLEGEFSINLKCDPDKALELRERYPAVQPGYHMNKKHWNTIYFDGLVADEIVYSWIDDSYNLVVRNLPKSKRNELATL
jgi:predicted DNA-binding protein (MmcQ/YjbR family)